MPVCFWEDLVNTVQEDCGGGGDGGDEIVSYVSSGNCGGSLGRFYFFESESMSEDLLVALAAATTVTITGTFQTNILADDFGIYAVGDLIADGVVFDNVEYAVAFDDGIYGAWVTAEIPALDAEYGIWSRIDVDGAIFYAATALATEC